MAWLPVWGSYQLFVSPGSLRDSLIVASLYLLIFLALYIWARMVRDQKKVLSFYGLPNKTDTMLDFFVGLLAGMGILGQLYLLEWSLGMLQVDWSAFQFSVLLEGVGVAVGLSLVEELFFRGWLLRELEQDYQLLTALVLSSFLFALLHYLKPLAQAISLLPAFPGLFLFGLLLALIKKYRSDSLGGSVGVHAGVIWLLYVTGVGQLFHYLDTASTWVVGVGGNPVAGVAGCSGLFGCILLLVILLRNKTEKSGCVSS